MNKISVTTEGTLSIDGIETGIADLTQEKLEELVNAALEDKIEFELEGASPLAKFFKTIQDATKAGAAFRAEIDALKAGEQTVPAADLEDESSGEYDEVDDEEIPF
jgi:hypothetical protein